MDDLYDPVCAARKPVCLKAPHDGKQQPHDESDQNEIKAATLQSLEDGKRPKIEDSDDAQEDVEILERIRMPCPEENTCNEVQQDRNP